MNIHRWRQLEASNPVLYETIFSVQKLQRRLIQCSEDIAQRDKLTREKEALYRELRTVLDRQPGSEVRSCVRKLATADIFMHSARCCVLCPYEIDFSPMEGSGNAMEVCATAL